MKRKTLSVKKLSLSRETLHELAHVELGNAAAAGSTPTLPMYCTTTVPRACTNGFCI